MSAAVSTGTSASTGSGCATAPRGMAARVTPTMMREIRSFMNSPALVTGCRRIATAAEAVSCRVHTARAAAGRHRRLGEEELIVQAGDGVGDVDVAAVIEVQRVPAVDLRS